MFLEERNGNYNTPYKFNAKELDEETGLYYYGARYLNPKTSLWLSTDPLAEKYPGWSPYNYALQNPVRMVDPDGRSPWDWVKSGPFGNWEYHSNIKSEAQAKAAGFTEYANGRGDAKSSYTTTLARNGVDIGVQQRVVLGEGGNYTVNGEAFADRDHFVNMKPVDNFGKFMATFVSFPMLLPASPYIFSGGSAEVLATKATISLTSQMGSTGDVDLVDFTADVTMFPGVGNFVGGVGDYSVKTGQLNIYGVTGNKTGNSVIIDILTGAAAGKASNGISNTFRGMKPNATTKVGENMFEFTNQLIKGLRLIAKSLRHFFLKVYFIL